MKHVEQRQQPTRAMRNKKSTNDDVETISSDHNRGKFEYQVRRLDAASGSFLGGKPQPMRQQGLLHNALPIWSFPLHFPSWINNVKTEGPVGGEYLRNIMQMRLTSLLHGLLQPTFPFPAARRVETIQTMETMETIETIETIKTIRLWWLRSFAYF